MAAKPGWHWFFMDTLPYLGRKLLLPFFALFMTAMFIFISTREPRRFLVVHDPAECAKIAELARDTPLIVKCVQD